MLPLPIDVRWNTVSDCLQAYLDNWAILVKVVETHRSNMDTNICDMILDISLKSCTQDYLDKMKPISVALDKLQANTCTIADAVPIWKDLEDNIPITVQDPFNK